MRKQRNESLQKIQPQLFGPDIASILMLRIKNIFIFKLTLLNLIYNICIDKFIIVTLKFLTHCYYYKKSLINNFYYIT